MKILGRAALAGVVAGLVVLAVVWRAWTGPGPLPEGGQAGSPVAVRVVRGDSWATVADTLAARGLLAHPRLLPWMIRLRGDGARLKTGRYEMPAGASARELADLLVAGRAVPVRVTLPEGWTVRRMATELAARLGFTAESFLVAADSLVRVRAADSPWAAAVSRVDSLQRQDARGILHVSEGWLAPDTYLFAEGSGPAAVAATLLRTQQERLTEAMASVVGGRRDAMSLLTLASLVETEARLDRERPLIAAVYANRLGKGWKLEADPTVAYILDRTGTRLFHRDLQVDSPYNTYRYPGLPPGPIACPGRASLLAAAVPDTTCRALFFVSDGAEGHVFSRTAADHERAVSRFRRERERQRRRTP